jgi:hypothetical protein
MSTVNFEFTVKDYSSMLCWILLGEAPDVAGRTCCEGFNHEFVFDGRLIKFASESP